MSFALLLPLGLLALAAWALPLLLHLARREQQQPTDFAALRWLAVQLKPRQRLRFEELPLLLLRLLLLAALALLLATPVWTGAGGDAGWLVVHPALAPPAAETGAMGAPSGAIADDATERRWLAPGFPPLTAPRPTLPIATASLLRQLDAELPAGSALAVRVPSWFDGGDGARLQLSRAVDWQVVAVAAPADTAVPPSAAPRLAVRHDAAHAADLRWLRATAVAWQAPSLASGDIAAPLPANTDVVAWLAAGAIPASLRDWVAAGGTALLAADATWPLEHDGAALWRDADGVVLASAAPLGRGRLVRLHRPLRPDRLPALLEADFPTRLRTLLLTPAPAPVRVDATMQAPRSGGAGFAAIPQSADSWLIVLVLVLFALERWFASGRRPEPRA